MKKILLLSFLACLSTVAHSASQIKKITKVGCHINTNTCFVYVEGGISSDCPVNDGSFRWNGVSDNNGNSALSILLSAHAQDKSVTFGESGCFSGFPSFTYLTINKT